MATFYRKNLISQSFPVSLNGETFNVSIRKMNTMEAISFLAAMAARERNLASREDKFFTTGEVADIINCIIPIVSEIHDLKDDDGIEVKWADLDQAARFALFNQSDFNTVMDIFNKAGTVGMLSEQEKKA